MPYKDLKRKHEWQRTHRAQRIANLKKNWEERPWLRVRNCIKSRCLNKAHHYYKRGIRTFLKTKDLKFLWFRDKAYLMTKPSIDRIDPKGHYVLTNCRFIELAENLRRSKNVRYSEPY